MLIVLEMDALVGVLSALFSIAVTASPVTRGRGAHVASKGRLPKRGTPLTLSAMISASTPSLSAQAPNTQRAHVS